VTDRRITGTEEGKWNVVEGKGGENRGERAEPKGEGVRGEIKTPILKRANQHSLAKQERNKR